jgi:Semialdehyde dehydrogenase, dimerisation domain
VLNARVNMVYVMEGVGPSSNWFLNVFRLIQKGMEELMKGTQAKLNGEEYANNVFVHPLPFNLIPHIDKFQVSQNPSRMKFVDFCSPSRETQTS